MWLASHEAKRRGGREGGKREGEGEMVAGVKAVEWKGNENEQREGRIKEREKEGDSKEERENERPRENAGPKKTKSTVVLA